MIYAYENEMNLARIHYAHESMPLIEHRRAKHERQIDATVRHRQEDSDRELAKRWLVRLLIVVVIALAIAIITLVSSLTSQSFHLRWSMHRSMDVDELACSMPPCFERADVTVREDRPGFPSFWRYANKDNITVTYDKRSLLLNGERALFLSGSMHPVRLTPATWTAGLDEAVRHGLNMITIYVFWAAHQPFSDMDFDWSLPNGQWDLTWAVRQAGNRGLFVHLRIGPYVCAEYNYGGIPEWVPLNKPGMAMRRPNQEWMDAMEIFVNETVRYVTEERLWAHQGGNIILAQVENELGDDALDKVDDNPIQVEIHLNGRTTLKSANMQDYADWCGDVAARVAPNVVWTMCNGLTAQNAINTCNGYGGTSCTGSWLESNGQSGRIQIDQPAMWTENEGGFQIWGETPSDPSDYFWGRTARDMAQDGLKFFSRGGSHLNYYMWLGGYNRGKSAAAGIMNMYASDVILCSSGQRHQPMYDHLQRMHEALAVVAPVLLECPSALNHSKPLPHLTPSGAWAEGPDQRMFVYARGLRTEVLFVENDSDEKTVVNIPFASGKPVRAFEMHPRSAALFFNGQLLFDSGTIADRAMSYKRYTKKSASSRLVDWTSWQEPIGARAGDEMAITDTRPKEQTDLMVSSRASSEYAWYETEFYLEKDLQDASITIDTQKASAMSVFVDGIPFGSADDHTHAEGNISLSICMGNLTAGPHILSILSESLGYFNLIGRWGASTKAKTKGITGNVLLTGTIASAEHLNESLVDGRDWRSRPGLNYEPSNELRFVRRDQQSTDGSGACPYWYSLLFATPQFRYNDEALFLDITTGRGRLWLNSQDLGRFWNITRGNSEVYSQRYYLLPSDLLNDDGSLNELLVFNAEGGDMAQTQLVASWTKAIDEPVMKDEVDFASACI